MNRTVEINVASVEKYRGSRGLTLRGLAQALDISEKTLWRLRKGGRTYRAIVERIHTITDIPRPELYCDPNHIGHDEDMLNTLLAQIRAANNDSNFGQAIALAEEVIETAGGFPDILFQAWEWWAISMDHAGHMEEAYRTLDQRIDDVPEHLATRKFWLEYQAACIRISTFEASCPTPGIARGSKSEQLLVDAEKILNRLAQLPMNPSEQLSIAHHLQVAHLLRGEPDSNAFGELYARRKETDYRRFYDKRRQAHALFLQGRRPEARRALRAAQSAAKNSRMATMISRDILWTE